MSRMRKVKDVASEVLSLEAQNRVARERVLLDSLKDLEMLNRDPNVAVALSKIVDAVQRAILSDTENEMVSQASENNASVAHDAEQSDDDGANQMSYDTDKWLSSLKTRFNIPDEEVPKEIVDGWRAASDYTRSKNELERQHAQRMGEEDAFHARLLSAEDKLTLARDYEAKFGPMEDWFDVLQQSIAPEHSEGKEEANRMSHNVHNWLSSLKTKFTIPDEDVPKEIVDGWKADSDYKRSMKELRQMHAERTAEEDDFHRRLLSAEEKLNLVLDYESKFGPAENWSDVLQQAIAAEHSDDDDSASEYAEVTTAAESDDQELEENWVPSSDTLAEVLNELDELIGLGRVKQEVRRLANYVDVRQQRLAVGLRGAEVTLHVVFYGNPGTGKTTVARLVGRIYRALGVLSKGHMVEADRSSLVDSIVGGTALKVQAVVQRALGGVLFIDEAYSLSRQSDMAWDFGREAVETLLKAMEDFRNDLVVIVAGYPNEMEQFLETNPGLASRFNNRVNFDDYSWEELLEIFEHFCRQNEYILSADAKSHLTNLLRLVCASRTRGFGNARFVRNLFDETVRNHASRVVAESADVAALMLIEWVDIPLRDSPSFPAA